MKKSVPFLFLIVIFGVAAWYFFTRESAPVHEIPPPELSPAVAVEPVISEAADDVTPVYQEPESDPVVIPEPLPPLSESDDEVKQVMGDMVGTDTLAEMLIRNEVVSRFVVMIDSLSSRQVPAQLNPVKPVSGEFVVVKGSDSVVMSAENFARYDGYVAMVEDLNSDEVVAQYRHYYPLLQQAWEENGGEGSFNDRIVEVIDKLLETPDVSGPVYLTKPEAVYLFADPDLEAMDAGQKILVRMGSFNAAIVKQKLREVRSALSP